MPSQKRTLSSAAASKAKKARVAADAALKTKCAEVCSAISAAEGAPKDVLTKLATAAKSILVVPQEERHASQARVVSMVSQVMADVKAAKAAAMAALKEKADGAEAERLARDLSCAAAASHLSEASTAEAAAKVAFETAVAEAAQALKTLQAEEAAQKVAVADFAKLEAKKEALDSASQAFVSLKADDCRAKAKLIKTLLKVGKECAFDSQLLVAAPASLEKKAGDRTGFDTLVFEQLALQLTGSTTLVDEQIAEASPAMAVRTSAIEGMKALHDVSVQTERGCKTAWDEAKKASKAAALEQKAATKHLRAFGKDVAETLAALRAATKEYEACKQTMNIFKDLESLQPMADPVEAEEMAEANTEPAADVVETPAPVPEMTPAPQTALAPETAKQLQAPAGGMQAVAVGGA